MRARSIIIGVVGAHNAGKTTLLTGTYVMAQRGEQIANARFAGSRSLEAWESLAAWTRFDDAARLPSFPPHTPRGFGRTPGLLHVALRGANDELRDVLLTDAPGEWFMRWAMQRDSPECEGARWTAENADGFLIVADCMNLSGEERGIARESTRSLIDRMGDVVDGRPVTFVWAKAEQHPPTGIRKAIENTLAQRIPHATQVESRLDQPATLCSAVGGIVKACWWPPCGKVSRVPVLSSTPFEAFRGHRDQA
ncbi:TRAFAC clade GTPase domain-containing protein [Nannocystaceae bacterium ST9]